MNNRLKELLTTPGVAGFEGDVRNYLESIISDYTATRVDACGNLIARLGTGSPSILFVAHMDEIGFLVTSITENGLLRFSRLGTIDERIIAGTTVSVYTDHGFVPGVIGIRPPHLGGGSGLDEEAYVIDVGADDPEEVRAMGIQPLAPATFFRVPRLLNGKRINCRGLDDRAGCYVLSRVCDYASKRNFQGTVTFAWSVQEETGLRGARAIANTLEFDIAIPIDVYATGSPAIRAANSHTPVTLGGGPALRMIDDGTIASFELGRWILEMAERNGIPMQMGLTGGMTDGLPMQETGAHMVPIGIAMRYLHSLAETADERDIESTIELLERLVDNSGELTRFSHSVAS